MAEQQIAINKIHPNPRNPRKEAGDVSGLVASIREIGLLQPIVVRTDTDNYGLGHYTIEAGFRRWTACRHVPLANVPCRVIELPRRMSPTKHQLLVGLGENIHREDLNALEKAFAFGRLRDEEKMAQAAIARAIGVSETTVGYHLLLLEAHPKTQEAVLKGTVSVEEVVQAVRRHRANVRKSKGQEKIAPAWEPDHFTRTHPLARIAGAMCDERGHNMRRRIGKRTGFKGACGQCWEMAIRNDQINADRVLTESTALRHATEPPTEATALPFREPTSNNGTRKVKS